MFSVVEKRVGNLTPYGRGSNKNTSSGEAPGHYLIKENPLFVTSWTKKDSLCEYSRLPFIPATLHFTRSSASEGRQLYSQAIKKRVYQSSV